ncbi:type I phosphomannose isomerase catalytic subunit [Brachyspira sp. SAP_772]|uniref:type I phosphomannose isomerase catalytic subunit n=1 Tax=Brachyspira sp. SAP_772 TaxID=2608385 RepID=UPI0012F49E42|nr:type I phosphomannose isomerase catalytic subunit [Brachyspira sp. SAP_772]
MYIFEFKEIGKESIWGGNTLVKSYSKPFDKDKNIGESWEICDLKNDKNVVSNGEFKDKNISFVIEQLGEKLLGTNCKNNKDFPLLIKLIDVRDKLSIQVHPDEEYANKKHNKHGKNEMWYIMEADKNAKLLIGLKKGIDKNKLKEAIENNENIENMFNYFDVKKGDAFYIPNGCIHAIIGDILIAEIQTPSDITYRLYDWNRVDKNGNSRELHIEDSFNVIKDIDAFQLKSKKENLLKKDNIEINNIFSNEYFIVEEYIIKNKYTSKTNNKTFEIILVIEGNGTIASDENSVELEAGKTVLLPAYLGKYSINSEKGIKLLRVTV